MTPERLKEIKEAHVFWGFEGHPAQKHRSELLDHIESLEREKALTADLMVILEAWYAEGTEENRENLLFAVEAYKESRGKS
jgi:hypothetical protein